MKDSFMKKLIILTLLSLHVSAQLCAMDRKSPMMSSPYKDLERAMGILDDLENDLPGIFSDMSYAQVETICSYNDLDASHPQRVKAKAENIIKEYAKDIRALEGHCNNPSKKTEYLRLIAIHNNLIQKHTPNSTPINLTELNFK